MSKRTAVVVAGALGSFLGGFLFAADQKPPSLADTLARRTPQGLTNDNCEDAIPIFDGDTDFDTTGANTDGLPHASCHSNGQAYHDVWYKYQATCTGELTVSTCCQASYRTELMVYDGCYDDTPCPPTEAELLGCNEEFPGCGWHGSRVAVSVVEGHCYTVRVGGQNEGHSGAGTVTLTCETAFCGDGICGPDENECSCSEDCPGKCPCVLFDNRIQFESFNEDQGQILKGIETFEESTLPPSAVLALDDPLCGGIPNVDPTTRWGFPDGLSQSNLCVQSNIDGESAPTPNPHGVDGLATASVSGGGGWVRSAI